MTDHTVALVPIESWAYNSPDQAMKTRQIDVGLLAEALVYYDRVLLQVGTQPQFAQLLEWLQAQGALDDFLALVRDGTITPYHYAFSTVPTFKEGQWSLWNLQGEDQKAPNAFERLFLYHPAISKALPRSRDRARLYGACRDRCIEIKASQVVGVVENARQDIVDPRRCAVLVQQYVNVLYGLRGEGRPPQVEATVRTLPGDGANQTSWNINFADLSRLGGPSLEFPESMPLSAGAICNRLLWSARDQSCDLFTGAPMAALIGDKLFETIRTAGRSTEILAQWKAGVDFPDVRAAVNSGGLAFADILRLRAHADSLRLWLQDASDRNLDALVAYHSEVAKGAGLSTAQGHSLRIIGWAAGAVLGSAAGGEALAGVAVGGAVSEGVKFLFDQAATAGGTWRPVVFGEWTRTYIEHALEKNRVG
jgi:hypothetical protein